MLEVIIVSSWRILAALVLILLGLLLLASNLGLFALRWDLFWPVILIFFGLWLIWRAFVPPPRNRYAVAFAGMGEYRPDLSGKEIRREEFSHGLGDFDLDLTRATIPDGENFVHVSHGMGDLTIIVPSSLAVRVQAKAGMGDVSVLGQRSEGIGPHVDFQSEDYATAARKLNIEASVGMGRVEVVRGS